MYDMSELRGGRRSDTAGGLSRGWKAILLALGGIGLSLKRLILFAWAVDGDFDRKLAALDFLPVHFRDGLLLVFLCAESDEGESTTLARLSTGLELADHETRNGAEGQFGGCR